MFPVMGVGVFLYQYLVVYIKGKHEWQIKTKHIVSVDGSLDIDPAEVRRTYTHTQHQSTLRVC